MVASKNKRGTAALVLLVTVVAIAAIVTLASPPNHPVRGAATSFPTESSSLQSASETMGLQDMQKPAQTFAPLCSPALQWEWDGAMRAPMAVGPTSTPLVVQLTDDNKDGKINSNDIPDIVFLHQSGAALPAPLFKNWSFLTAVEGTTGKTIFLLNDTVGIDGFESLGAGDIDGDGIVELVAPYRPWGTSWTTFYQLRAFENDGKLEWTSQKSPSPFTQGPIGFADLNQDGKPEIYISSTVFNANGSFRWQGNLGKGVDPVVGSQTAIAHAVDLISTTPGLELLAGNTAYDANGKVVWNNPAVPDGWTAVADFTKDNVPEIVLAGHTRSPSGVDSYPLYMLDNLGKVLGIPYFGFADRLAQPIIADVDGDCKLEVIENDGKTIKTLSWVGNAFQVKWSQPINDNSRLNGAAAYDFDGDGAAEVVYHDQEKAYILDGKTGATLWSDPFPSMTWIETPTIADIDNDGKTEILFGGYYLPQQIPPTPGKTNRIAAYECQTPGTVARAIWNQYQYHITNVNDEGTIPQIEQKSWLNDNSWFKQLSKQVVPKPSCTAAACGNNVTDPKEECDDANSDPADRCNNCIITYCGDGLVQNPNGKGTGGISNDGNEQCDDGNNVPKDGCTNCTLDSTLAVNFAYSKATCAQNGILVQWGTTTETNTIGFYVQWSDKKTGPFSSVSPFTYATGSGSDYQWPDTNGDGSPATPQSGIYNWYKVQEIAATGPGDATEPFTTNSLCQQEPTYYCGTITGLSCPEGYTCVCPSQKGGVATSDEQCACQKNM